MERQVKERLVGAAVLMAAAVILIPEMLSGPAGEKQAPPAPAAGEMPVKTYTIDLSKAPSQPAVPDAVPDTRAPPTEASAEPQTAQATKAAAPEPADQAIPQPRDSETPVAPSRDEVAATEPKATAQPASAPSKDPSPQRPPPAPTRSPALASELKAPTTQSSSGWAVQLGSFASRGTADRLAAEVRGSGDTAFVMPVKSGNNTLYRVRVGPFSTRAAADEASRRVKGKYAGAAIVSHP